MQYKGIELKEITSKVENFQPHKMLCWSDKATRPLEEYVVAIVKRSDDMLFITDHSIWPHGAEIPEEQEHTISQITDRLGNVVKLPFPMTVTTSRLDKHSAETVLMQVVKKLSDHIIKIQRHPNIVNDLKSDARF